VAIDRAKRKRVLAWAASRDSTVLACRVTRGSHWWPDILDTEHTKVEWNARKRCYDTVMYCQRGCGAKVVAPIAKTSGLILKSHMVYQPGYQFSQKDGNEFGMSMDAESKGYIRAELLKRREEGGDVS
jgi:hypothetical protein